MFNKKNTTKSACKLFYTRNGALSTMLYWKKGLGIPWAIYVSFSGASSTNNDQRY